MEAFANSHWVAVRFLISDIRDLLSTFTSAVGFCSSMIPYGLHGASNSDYSTEEWPLKEDLFVAFCKPGNIISQFPSDITH